MCLRYRPQQKIIYIIYKSIDKFVRLYGYMNDLKRLQHAITGLSGMTEKDFELSVPFWKPRQYKKGEFYNEYKSVCTHLAFVLTGMFRIYKFLEEKKAEKNMLFFSNDQFMCSLKSFLNQTACDYHTEAMADAGVLYIHFNDLQHLYSISPAWERFGRMFAEAMLNALMMNVESLLFMKPEDRYTDLLRTHPDIGNTIPLYHIASYLGIEGPSLSRIRSRMQKKKQK